MAENNKKFKKFQGWPNLKICNCQTPKIRTLQFSWGPLSLYKLDEIGTM
jgi:hypothetical protein